MRSGCTSPARRRAAGSVTGRRSTSLTLCRRRRRSSSRRSSSRSSGKEKTGRWRTPAAHWASARATTAAETASSRRGLPGLEAVYREANRWQAAVGRPKIDGSVLRGVTEWSSQTCCKCVSRLTLQIGSAARRNPCFNNSWAESISESECPPSSHPNDRTLHHQSRNINGGGGTRAAELLAAARLLRLISPRLQSDQKALRS